MADQVQPADASCSNDASRYWTWDYLRQPQVIKAGPIPDDYPVHTARDTVAVANFAVAKTNRRRPFRTDQKNSKIISHQRINRTMPNTRCNELARSLAYIDQALANAEAIAAEPEDDGERQSAIDFPH